MLFYVLFAIPVLLLLAVIVAGVKTLREAREAREAAERLNTFAERVRRSDEPWTD